MNHDAMILYPLFAMMLLVMIVVTLLWLLRRKAISSKAISIEFYRSYTADQGSDEPEYNKVVSRHYSNLFEMPVLFYVVVLLCYVTQQVTSWMVWLSWGYVAARYVHSYVHLTRNNVVLRFLVFVVSSLILLSMWIGLLVMLLQTG